MSASLDLFSTSQTFSNKRIGKQSKNSIGIYDECLNNAPFFAYQIEGKKYGVVQGCCNDWLCPRCGKQRAKEEYGRIVHGAREIGAKHDLYMFTITCRGKDCTIVEAETNYLVWTNNLLTNLRASCKRAGKPWFYASVTERQEREHPHSHYLTTYYPSDCIDVPKGQPKYFYTQKKYQPAKHDTLQSRKLERAVVKSGLGWQYDISRLESVEGASRYVAKYLFKESVLTTKWPDGWRRVRYSQEWPQLPEVKGNAFILMEKSDWYRLSRVALIVTTKDDFAKRRVMQELNHSDTIVM
jgi:hypothetical protein